MDFYLDFNSLQMRNFFLALHKLFGERSFYFTMEKIYQKIAIATDTRQTRSHYTPLPPLECQMLYAPLNRPHCLTFRRITPSSNKSEVLDEKWRCYMWC